MYKKLIFIFILTSMLTEAWPQEVSVLKREYLHGRDMYQEGHYEMAMEILKPLTLPANESAFSPYAGYYYSLSAFNENYTYLAEDMLKHVLEEYQDWDKADLAKFWLVKIYLTEEEFREAIKLSDEIRDQEIQKDTRELIKVSLADQASLPELIDLYRSHSDLRPLAEVLADKIVMQPLPEQDRDLLKEIVNTFDLNPDKYKIIEVPPTIYRDEYNVAILLPFMYRDIIPDQVRRNNQFILDLYEGIKLAGNWLEEQGIRLNLYAFDTERDSTVMRKIIDSGELAGVDLIIGPLYPGPVKIASEYALENRINMFNPLSSNSKLIRHNPFCFLIKPTTEREALAVKDYVSNYLEHPYGMIFYEDSESDSIKAHTYYESIVEEGFDIVYVRKIWNEDTFSVYNLFTEKVKFEDVALTEEDSAWYIDRYDLYDYFEKLRTWDEEEDGKIRPLELYTIPPDSIGHIFVASDKELIGANVISGIGARGDSTLIIGEESWLNFRSLSLEQWELLDILLIAPGYIDSRNPALEDISQQVIYTYNKPPSRYHFLGYEAFCFLGEMLHQYGVFFQHGMREEGFHPGILFQGFDYSEGNDNAIVPLIKFENSEFIIVNKDQIND